MLHYIQETSLKRMLAGAQVHKRTYEASIGFVGAGYHGITQTPPKAKILISITHISIEKLLYFSLPALGLNGKV